MILEKDEPKTAFCMYWGLLEHCRMPFVLITVPATFQWLLNKVLTGLQHYCAMAYLDDISIYNDTFENHLKYLTGVFNHL